jgi:P-type Cu+ transporter
MAVLVQQDLICYHCGLACEDEKFKVEDKHFCCYGCKTVFEILNENDLCEYYSFDKNPGVNLRFVSEESFAYLDEPTIRKKVIEFDSDSFVRVRFYVPAIHCISCIWLLENLQRLQKGIVKSEVNFAGKTVRIDFNPTEVSLSKVARLITSLGYTPKINLKTESVSNTLEATKSLVVKLAIAGFGFGNIMLLSFPEYLGLDKSDESLQRVFSFLNIALAIPVTFYCGKDYFLNAWKSFSQRMINIDVPIAVGLLALFLRSVYDIVFQVGPGYLDSLSGLVFFLLIGRWFQGKTYENLAFDRDYKSYFPLAVHKRVGDSWKPVVVYELMPGDEIRVRNMEIVPADCLLESDEAYLDYSFVTGESKPVHVKKGASVYAGGRLIGQPVLLSVVKRTSQSHLTSLWNEAAFQKPEESKYRRFIDLAARRFTWVVLGLTIVTAVFWNFYDPSRMWLVITSVLIVACPCALALATPFTYGNMVRVFGRNGFYLKNAEVLERMAAVDSVVFDKTGTITYGATHVKFVGVLDDQELSWIKLLTSTSTHPLSTLIANNISQQCSLIIEDFAERAGKGVEGRVGGVSLKIGSATFTGFDGIIADPSSKVFVSLDNQVRGYFLIETSIRPQIRDLVSKLGNRCVALLSGDNDTEEVRMRSIFSTSTNLLFNQSPHDKLNYISSLQKEGSRVLMIGDGLNDSGALRQSDVGVAVTDDTGVFTPACDGILAGDRVGQLDKFLKLSRSATTILKTGFAISFFYNAITLGIAMSGYLTPLVAAILMPISSISVVGFSTIAVNWVSNKTFKE